MKLQSNKALNRKNAFSFIIFLGLVSLFADMTYEGSRSINGPYLALLGANAVVVGFVSGLGELLGYVLRIVSGYLADRTGKYWAITILGYISILTLVVFSVSIQLLAIPVLGIVMKKIK